MFSTTKVDQPTKTREAVVPKPAVEGDLLPAARTFDITHINERHFLKTTDEEGRGTYDLDTEQLFHAPGISINSMSMINYPFLWHRNGIDYYT